MIIPKGYDPQEFSDICYTKIPFIVFQLSVYLESACFLHHLKEEKCINAILLLRLSLLWFPDYGTSFSIMLIIANINEEVPGVLHPGI